MRGLSWLSLVNSRIWSKRTPPLMMNLSVTFHSSWAQTPVSHPNLETLSVMVKGASIGMPPKIASILLGTTTRYTQVDRRAHELLAGPLLFVP
jgi:hypothetical protein